MSRVLLSSKAEEAKEQCRQTGGFGFWVGGESGPSKYYARRIPCNGGWESRKMPGRGLVLTGQSGGAAGSFLVRCSMVNR